MLPVQTQEKIQTPRESKPDKTKLNIISQRLDTVSLAGPSARLQGTGIVYQVPYRERSPHFCHKLRSVPLEILAAEAAAESKAMGKHLCDLQTH